MTLTGPSCTIKLEAGVYIKILILPIMTKTAHTYWGVCVCVCVCVCVVIL